MIEFDETVSPDDHMVTTDISSYMRVARAGLDSVLDSLSAVGRAPETITSVLDFGSGYGRVYRALAAAFPDAKLTACDLMAPAAKFCADTFGGDWVQSHEDLGQVKLPRKYDLVWLGSVFTHLPEARWDRLLDFLGEYTEKDGLVVFTSHGERAIYVIENNLMKRNPYAIDADLYAEMKQVIPNRGFYFIPNKPAAIKHQKGRGIDVSEGEYGFSFCSEAWVRNLFEKKSNWECVNYAPAGWANNHDVVTIKRL